MNQALRDATISLAVEDKHVLFCLHKPDGLLPSGDMLDLLIESFEPLRQYYHPILDVGGLNAITSDVIEFVEMWSQTGADIIVDKDQEDIIEIWPKCMGTLTKVNRRDWRFHDVPLVHILRDDGDIYLYGLKPVLEEIEASANREYQLTRPGSDLKTDLWIKYHGRWAASDAEDDWLEARGAFIAEQIEFSSWYLKGTLREIGRNCLMVQLALLPNKEDEIAVVPYHGHALYPAAANEMDDSAIISRPSVLAKRTQAIFGRELAEFTRLVSDPKTTENSFQRFFEDNDSFIRMLGYKRIYPQVVLERDDGTSLRPDFMLEPFDTEFWDVLELKRPNVGLVTGARDRKKFSEDVSSLLAQMREYSAYFEEEKYRKRISNRYGIKAYRPRLIGVIGTHYDTADEIQLRRMLTQYSDSRIYTFEQLRKIAESRLLI